MKDHTKPQQSQQSTKDAKKSYEAPKLEKHGSVESLTQHEGNGGCSKPLFDTKRG